MGGWEEFRAAPMCQFRKRATSVPAFRLGVLLQTSLSPLSLSLYIYIYMYVYTFKQRTIYIAIRGMPASLGAIES